MRIVLITGDNLEHRYVGNKLAGEIELVGIVIDHGQPIDMIGKARRYLRRYTLPQIGSRACLLLLKKVWKDKSTREQNLQRIFGVNNCLEFRRQELLHHVHGINSRDGASIVSSLQPDVILVFGTGIVKDEVLGLGRLFALNLHTGISPYYRGSDCTFWPIHNQELHMLGATVHRCTKEVDGGEIFATTGICLNEDDNIFTIFGKCVMAGADLYVRVVRRLPENGLRGAVQDFSVGREYRAFMRGLTAEFKVRRSLAKGLVRQFVATHPGQQFGAEHGNL
jgi:methionyl-tRNA formyltransferase